MDPKGRASMETNSGAAAAAAGAGRFRDAAGVAFAAADCATPVTMPPCEGLAERRRSGAAPPPPAGVVVVVVAAMVPLRTLTLKTQSKATKN